jgi:hypothetical protein
LWQELEAPMSRARFSAVLTAATVVLGLAAIAPAHAEFFGCNDRPGKVLYDSSWHSGSRYSRYAHDYSTQPRHVARARVTYSSARRYYDSRYH